MDIVPPEYRRKKCIYCENEYPHSIEVCPRDGCYLVSVHKFDKIKKRIQPATRKESGASRCGGQLSLAARFAEAQTSTMCATLVAVILGSHFLLDVPLPGLGYALQIAGAAIIVTFCVSVVAAYLGTEVTQNAPWIVAACAIFIGGYIMHESDRVQSREENLKASPIAGMLIAPVETNWSTYVTSDAYRDTVTVSGKRLIILERNEGSIALTRSRSSPLFREPPGKLVHGSKSQNQRPTVAFLSAIPTIPTGRMRLFHGEEEKMSGTNSFGLLVDNALDRDILLCVDEFGPERLAKREQRKIALMEGNHQFVVLSADANEVIEAIRFQGYCNSNLFPDSYFIYNVCGSNTYTSVLVDLD